MTEHEFRAFVAARTQALRRSAYLLTGDYGLAEDVVQTALTSTWTRLRRLRDPAALESYVRRSMVRAAISWRRKKSSGEIPTTSVPDRGGDDVASSLVEHERMWDALKDLPRQQRAVLVLRYYEDLSEQDIAHALGCSTGTVKSHASRGLATLRQVMDVVGRETVDGQS